MPSTALRIISVAVLLIAALLFQSCAEEESQISVQQTDAQNLPIIRSRDELSRVISEAGDRLLLLDFFADWCLPCKQLEPVLKEIDRKAKENVDVYRIDIDSNQALAQGFQVRGIPYVVFVKNQVIVYKLEGLHPKQSYWDVIREFSSNPAS
jgi:thioredoxin 1